MSIAEAYIISAPQSLASVYGVPPAPSRYTCASVFPFNKSDVFFPSVSAQQDRSMGMKLLDMSRFSCNKEGQW